MVGSLLSEDEPDVAKEHGESPSSERSSLVTAAGEPNRTGHTRGPTH